MVFNKEKAPTEPIEFLKWYYEKADWDSERDYNDIKGTYQPLADFFKEIIKEYPAMNGVYAPTDEEIENNIESEDKLTDYTIDDDLIYMAFAWSEADNACKRVKELAYKNGLGYFDMFRVHLDKETVIDIPQIRREELNRGEKKQESGVRGFFDRLFGK